MAFTKAQRLHWIRRVCDSFLYLTAIVGVVISATGVVAPRNAYVRCNDPNISHDLQKDTISVSQLLLVSLVGPLAMMMLFERVHCRQGSLSTKLYNSLRSSYSFFLSLLVGNLFAFFIVEVLKTAVSEPRPHFMNSCNPNLTQELCQKPWVHITHSNCSNPRQLNYIKLIDTMKSFPSGHASIGVFSAVFMTMYIQQRVRVSWSTLLVAWLQLIWWTWAFLCCASRVWDHQHHWWDVLFGGVLGGVAGYATVVYLCNYFKVDQEKQSIESHLPSVQEFESPCIVTNAKERNGNYGKPNLELEETSPNHRTTEPTVQRLFE